MSAPRSELFFEPKRKKRRQEETTRRRVSTELDALIATCLKIAALLE